MSLIDSKLIGRMAQSIAEGVDLKAWFTKFQAKYRNSFEYNELEDIIEKVRRINLKPVQTETEWQVEEGILKGQSFCFGELKLYTWVLVVYCNLNCVGLEQLKDTHFQELRAIFPCHSFNFIKYKTLCLAYQKIKHASKWSEEEIQLLTRILSQTESLKEWRSISYEFFCLSNGKYFRPFSQCREKWFNHLDPKVFRGKWTIEEDIALLSAVEFLDTRWNEISRELGGVRTEHMIKNRYKSILNKWKKKYGKTSPKKIISIALKNLKINFKKGSVNSSFSDHEAEPESKPEKRASTRQPKPTTVSPAQNQPAQALILKEKSVIRSLNFSPAPTEKEALSEVINEDGFDLGLGLFNKSCKEESEKEAELDQRYSKQINRRQYKFSQCVGGKEQRQTAEEQDDFLCSENDLNEHVEPAIEYDHMMTVPGFYTNSLLESEDEWLRDLERRYERQEMMFDFIDY